MFIFNPFFFLGFFTPMRTIHESILPCFIKQKGSLVFIDLNLGHLCIYVPSIFWIKLISLFQISTRADYVSHHHRCLCSLSKVAAKGASVVEYLIQVFFKRLDAQGIDNKQVGSYN